MFNKTQLSQMMKQMQTMQEKLRQEMEQTVASLDRIEVAGESGAGLVKVQINGNCVVRKINVDPSLLAEDKDMLEDLLVAAVNDAFRKAQKISEEKKNEASRGVLPELPGGMKYPF